MKLLFKWLTLCLMGFFCSQIAVAQSNAFELTGVTLRPLNISYLNAVLDDRMPESITSLENKAARYNIFTSSVYNGEFDAYEVVFEQEKGKITAVYDNDGKIIRSTERFKDVPLPVNVREVVHNQYPGWEIHSDSYVVSYFYKGKVKKVFKAQLRKNGERRNIKMIL